MRVFRDSEPIRIDKSFDMPSIPLVLMRILQVLDNDTATSSQLEALILHDPPLSARILKLANSAFYSFRAEVKTIAHAISLLGLNLVKSLAIGVTVFDSFSTGVKGEAITLNKLWIHSFGVAMVAQEIWTRRSSRQEGEFAFMCGLLHDIGKMVFFKRDPREYRTFFLTEKTKNDPDISRQEVDYFGIDHASIGAMLAKEWGLPPELATVIRYHHSPLDSNVRLPAVISMADMVAKVTDVGYDGDRMLNPAVERIQASLRMSADECKHLMAFSTSHRKHTEDFFQLST